MPIAQTTPGDAIAVIIFATVLFLIIVGVVLLTRWLLRSISRKPEKEREEAAWNTIKASELPKKPESESPKKWIMCSYLGRLLSFFGIMGLAIWNLTAKTQGFSENQFRATTFGNFLAWLVGLTLLSGLILILVSSVCMRTFHKNENLLYEDSTTSQTLKYVLLFVFFIFVLILFLV